MPGGRAHVPRDNGGMSETPLPREVRRLGVVGAGRFGCALARLALRARLDVLVASTRHPADLGPLLLVNAPGATAATAEEAATRTDVVVLALPLGRLRALDPAPFRGRVVIDATNYSPLWDNRLLPEVAAAPSTSELVQRHLVGAHVVKTLNHLGADELEHDAAPPGQPGRRALAVAGDDDGAVGLAMGLVERLGFDAVDAGPLAAGKELEPRSHVFNGLYDRDQLTVLFAGRRRPRHSLPADG